MGLRPRREQGTCQPRSWISEDGGVFASPSQTPQGSLQDIQATAPLPARVSIGTASPVPEAADRPPSPLPSANTCKQQVEASPCQWPHLHPFPSLAPLSFHPPQAWSAFSLDPLVPLRPLKGEGMGVEGSGGGVGGGGGRLLPPPCKVTPSPPPAKSTGPERRALKEGPAPSGTLNADSGRGGAG